MLQDVLTVCEDCAMFQCSILLVCFYNSVIRNLSLLKDILEHSFEFLFTWILTDIALHF